MTLRTNDTGCESTSATCSPTASYTTPTPFSFTTDNKRRYFVGQDIIGFHKRKARGDILPHTDFVQVEMEGRFLTGSANWEGNGQSAAAQNWPGTTGAWRLNSTSGNDPTVKADLSYADYHVQKAADRIVTKGWDAMTFAAELPKLRDQLLSLAERIGRLKKAPVKTLKSISRSDILGSWMEGRYAYRTLAFDLQDMHEAFNSFDSARRVYNERSGYTYPQHDVETMLEGTSFSSALITTVVGETHHSISVRGAVTGSFEPSRIITNPITTAWELTPLSFIVDWVFDLGTYLNSLQFMHVSSKYAASHGFRCESFRTVTATSNPAPGYSGSESFSYQVEGVRETRVPTSINPKPQLTGRQLTPSMLLDLTALSRRLNPEWSRRRHQSLDKHLNKLFYGTPY